MHELKLTVTEPPHLKSSESVPRAMVDTFLALVPITLASIWFYGLNAVFLIVVCLATAVLTDLIVRSIKGKPPTLGDGSVLVTGLLVALCFSPLTGWWIGMWATFLAIAVGKEWMGGLGWNRFNPAAFGRVAVVILAPVTVFLNQQFQSLRVSFPVSQTVADVMTGATPLALLKQGNLDVGYGTLLLGHPGGALAETSALMLLLGGAYLLLRKHITWHVPVSMIGTVLVLTALLGQSPIHHVLTGGLLLGALFMATDWVTSPITDTGRLVFGALIGVLVVVFRVALAPTEGVAFAILIMNAFVPVIDRITRRRVFGQATASRTA